MNLKLHHVSIPVPFDQLDAGREFYRRVFGLREIDPPEVLGRERFAWFELDGRELHLFVEEGANSVVSGRHLAFEVEDLVAFRAHLREQQVEIEEAIEIPNRPRLFVNDPFGNRIEVTQVLGPFR
jgi:catechol 2,3-dioxygenase-like lactoylglutathione lyase family enzyme